MFVVMPGLFMGLSFAGMIYVIVAAGLLLAIFMFVLVVNLIRSKKPSWLPSFLASWKWLPIWFRSLEPYDAIFTQMACCKKLKEKSRDSNRPTGNSGFGDTELTASDDRLNRVDVDRKRGRDNPGFQE
jgi:sodium-dependent phosphate cotransporter